MAVSDDELQGLREENDRLRQQIAEADNERSARDAAASREITAVQLKAENARLEAVLAQSKIMADASGPEGTATLIETVQHAAEPEVYELVAEPIPTEE